MRTMLFSGASLALLLVACSEDSDHAPGGEVQIQVTGSDDVGKEKVQELGAGWGSHNVNDRVTVECSRSQYPDGKYRVLIGAFAPVEGHSSYEEGFDLVIREFAGAGTYKIMGSAVAGVSARVPVGRIPNSTYPAELVELAMVATSACTFVAKSELEGTFQCSDLTQTSLDLTTGKSELLPGSIAIKGKWSCDN